MLGGWGKRIFDVIVATILLILVLPMIAILAVGTAVSLRAWPFFTQRRVGRHGRQFMFIKLRTLPTCAPRYASKYELVSVRVPKFTMAMRKLHLDELPQLLLVAIGRMSLVGPRPDMSYLAAEYGTEFETLRTEVRPGCTGLWQISEHRTGMIYEHPEYDRFYIENRTFRFDLWIVARTVRMHLPGAPREISSVSEVPGWVLPAPRRTPAIDLTVVEAAEPAYARFDTVDA